MQGNPYKYNIYLETLTNYCVNLAPRLSQSTLVGLKARIRPVIRDLDTEVYFLVYDGSREQNTQKITLKIVTC